MYIWMENSGNVFLNLCLPCKSSTEPRLGFRCRYWVNCCFFSSVIFFILCEPFLLALDQATLVPRWSPINFNEVAHLSHASKKRLLHFALNTVCAVQSRDVTLILQSFVISSLEKLFRETKVFEYKHTLKILYFVAWIWFELSSYFTNVYICIAVNGKNACSPN